MSITAVKITEPLQNNILQGECMTYANHGLPTQTLLGASNGGAEVNIEREINLTEFDGSYGAHLDSEGTPLCRYKRLIGKVKLNQLYLKYFNSKVISNCESDGLWESGNWAGDGGTYAAETSIVNSGDQAAKCSIASAQTGHGIHEVFASSKDLTVFDNSEASTTSDYIGFAIYITTAMLAILGTDSIRIIFHMDAETTETNLYYYDVEATDLTANEYTSFKVLKSAFTETGTGDWSAVTGVSVEVPDETDDALEFYIDSIDLIQAQSNSSIVPMNAGGFNYINETTHRVITPTLEITEDDYLENITIIGQKMDGKRWKIVLKNCFNDGEISLAFEEFKDVVNETEFTGHYKRGSETTAPIEIYEYVA